jgi:hypothetical protein
MRKLQISLIMVAIAVGSHSQESSSLAGTPNDSPPSEKNMSGARQRHGANCPAALPGTETKIKMTPRGVDVSITAKDPLVQRNVALLAEFHASRVTAAVSRPHNGLHGSDGRMGYCPIIVNAQTKVTATPIPGGVTLHVDALSAARVKEMQALIKQRAQQLPGYLPS